MWTNIRELLIPDEQKKQAAIEDSVSLINIMGVLEDTYFETTGKSLTVMDAARVICYSRWSNGRNPGNFVHKPEQALEDLFKEYMVIENCRSLTSLEGTLQYGLNNSHIAWPAALEFQSAFDTASKVRGKDKHVQLAETYWRFSPAIRINLQTDKYISQLCSYDKVGEKYREQIIRGMLFSFPGELNNQGPLGLAEIPELRGDALGLIVTDKVMKSVGIRGLYNLPASDFFRMTTCLLPDLETHIMEHEGLMSYIDNYNMRNQKMSSRAVSAMIKTVYKAAENNPSLRKIRGFRWIYGNLRSTNTNSYDSLPFGEFPWDRALSQKEDRIMSYAA